MAFELPSLPYALDALEPYISAETLRLHHGRHHHAYLMRLEALVKNTPHIDASLETLIMTTQGACMACAVQAWNHTFFWHCLSPWGGGSPQGPLRQALEERWGSFEAFQDVFEQQALAHPASGWTWLVKTAENTLDIVNIDDASIPLMHDQTPVLTIDMWEHAYYLDYRDDRLKYLQAFWQVVNWEFAAQNFAG